jgi:hypothetical protein
MHVQRTSQVSLALGWDFGALAFGDLSFTELGVGAERQSRAAQCAGLPTEKQCRSILPPGQELRQGEKLVSPNGKYMAILQTDSNFVIYNGSQPLRAWGQNGTIRAFMQTDGVFALYGPGDSLKWDSGTQGNGGARLVMQDDANLVVYAPNGRDLWSSETNGPRVYEPSRSIIDVITAPTRSAAEAAIYAATGQHVTVTSVSVSPAQIAAAVQAVMSFVPVIGTGINAAIAAGTALANGENITDAIVAGAKNALPGGPLASKGFDIAYGAVKAIANGQPLDEIALAAAREALPSDAAKKAFDIGTAIAHGQNVQQALVSEAASFAAGQLDKIALPPMLTEVARSIPPEATRVATAIVNHPELANLAASEIARRLGTNEVTVNTASKAVTAAKNSSAMAELAKLTPQQQKDLVAYIALARLTPDQQKQLAEYIKAKTKPKPLMSVHETTPARKPVVATAPKAAPKPTVTARAGVYPPYPKMGAHV